jgi:hypothetical protein
LGSVHSYVGWVEERNPTNKTCWVSRKSLSGKNKKNLDYCRFY